MTEERKNPSEASASQAFASGLLPPYRVVADFLDADSVALLMDHAIHNEANFYPAMLQNRVVNPEFRVSFALQDVGAVKSTLKEAVNQLTPALIRDLRVTPFE